MQFRAIATPEGTADRMFADCAAMRRVRRSVTDLFRRRGYDEVMTPVVEYYDLFSDFPQETMRMMVDRTGRLLVMRPDNTLPVARLAAARLKNLNMPQRLYYNQTVFRTDAAHTAVRGEIAQCGVELIGASGARADLEVLSMAVQSLEAAGIREYRLELGHAGFFAALAEELPQEQALALHACLENGKVDAYQEALSGVEDEKLRCALSELPWMYGGAQILEKARGLFGGSAVGILNELESLYRELEAAGLGEKVVFDLGYVTPRGYYTGMVFRGYALGAGNIVLSGGRYDRLLGSFGFDAPSAGFALDAAALAECIQRPEEKAPRKVVYYENGCLGRALQICMAETAGTCILSAANDLQEARKRARESGARELIIVSQSAERSEEL